MAIRHSPRPPQLHHICVAVYGGPWRSNVVLRTELKIMVPPVLISGSRHLLKRAFCRENPHELKTEASRPTTIPPQPASLVAPEAGAEASSAPASIRCYYAKDLSSHGCRASPNDAAEAACDTLRRPP
jgi:hypothetical protein